MQKLGHAWSAAVLKCLKFKIIILCYYKSRVMHLPHQLTKPPVRYL